MPPRTASPAAPAIGRPLRARGLASVARLVDLPLLDRVVRGRWWIPLVAVLLVALVSTQVETLKLNASIGHSVVQANRLAGENQSLRASISRLSDDQRVESEAAGLGLSMPAATQPLFLSGSERSNLARALRNIHAPDPTGFAAQTAATATARAAAVTYSSGQ